VRETINFQDKLVLITGGSSGIGKQIAADLLRAGAKVIIVSNQSEKLELAREELLQISPAVYAAECDVGNPASVLRMRGEVIMECGCPDIIINNAGFATYRPFECCTLEEIERIISVNLTGAMRCTHVFLQEMIARRSGTIVNMADISGRMIITPHGTYCAAKHGLVAWSETLKYELSPFNLKVAVVCPGKVQTPFFDHESFKQRNFRTENFFAIPVEEVSKATLEAISNRRFMTVVPRSLGIVAWLLEALPYPLRVIYERLMISRVKDIYVQKR
jgi:uncharacterized protein